MRFRARMALLSTSIVFLLRAAAAMAEAPTYFVFDLDDTLWRWVRPDEATSGNISSMVTEHRYRFLDGAGEAIQALLDRVPNAKIAFYSGGPRDRNLALLNELKLPDGRRAIEVAEKVLSTSDIVDEKDLPRGLTGWGTLDRRQPPPEMLYDLRKKGRKDLLKIAPDLDHVILIDDRMGYVYPGQEKNLAWVGTPPDRHPEKFNETRLSRKGYIQYRNKLTRMIGLIDRALEISQTKMIPLPEALFHLQWKVNPDGTLAYQSALLTDAALYRRGARLLSKTKSSRYRFITPRGDKLPPCLIPIWRLLRAG